MDITPIVHPLAFLRLPYAVLGALDLRSFHFALQPVHYLVRVAHILSASIFFGILVLLDVRLMGLHPGLAMRGLAEAALPWLYGTFAIALTTGLLLFFYDPVHVGSHGFFSPKLLLLALALANTLWFRRFHFGAAFSPSGAMPAHVRLAGAVSCLLWLGVMVCSMLNTEAAPNLAL